MGHLKPESSLETNSSLRMGKRYRASRLKVSYDAVIIGSGLGGLSCAVALSKMGKRVLVLERHYTIGGFTHCFEKNGYEWCTGLHYVGEMGQSSSLRNIMDFISNKNLQWASMGDNYDSYFLNGERFDIMATKEGFRSGLIKKFPAEAAAIDKYIKLVNETQKASQLFFMPKLLPIWLGKILTPFINRRLPKNLNQTTYDVLRSITENEQLISVLCAQWGGCGTPPKKMSFFMHAGAVSHYLNGAYYPIGGGSQIARHAVPIIEAAGGDVFAYAEVDSILTKHRKTIGLRMADGHHIECNTVISAAGAYNTYQRLLNDADLPDMDFANATESVGPSAAHIGMFLGLAESAEELNLPKTNYWIQPNFAHDKNHENFWQDVDAPFPLVYITFPSAKDPSFQDRYPGKATIEAVVLTPFAHFDAWDRSNWNDRGEEYEAFKERLKNRILDEIYKVLPQISNKIEHCEISTPLSTNHFNNGKYGEIYGLTHTPHRYEQRWLRPETSIKGLFLTGQDAFTMGIAGAATGGILTAFKVLGFRQGLKLMKLVGM